MPKPAPTECPPLFNPPEWVAFEGLVGDAFQRHVRTVGQPIVHVLAATPDDHRTPFAYLLICVPNDWPTVRRLLTLRTAACRVFGASDGGPVATKEEGYAD